MIRKYAGEMEVVCDTCGEESSSYDEDEFEAMLTAVKADGWKIRQISGRWEHECSDCAKDGSALAAAKRKFGLA